MLYLRVFEGCNVYCEHCFIPNNPKKMDQEDFTESKVIKLLGQNSNLKDGDTIYIQWHGGEPTALGLDYLKNAIEKTQGNSVYKYKNGIQTNLITFSDDPVGWSNFYKTYFDNNVGVSWDYSIRHLKKKGTQEETNALYEDKFWSNVNLAKEYGLNLYFVITLTKELTKKFKNPMDLVEFLVGKSITHVNFERITKTGEARLNWDKLGLNNAEYSSYMSKLFNAYFLYKKNNPEITINISPFDGLIGSVESLLASIRDGVIIKPKGYGCWSGSCDTNFHTVDATGYKSGCTALNSEQDNSNKALNNHLTGKKIIWLNNEKTQENKFLKLRAERKVSCKSCEFNSICSSGCLSVEKWDDSGECSGGRNLFATIKKRLSMENI